jgi:phosphoribulokinase
MDTILRRMPDYTRYICPQFTETDINFQRVPTVDTSNPFTARWIPTADESMVIIRFAKPRGIDFPYLATMMQQARSRDAADLDALHSATRRAAQAAHARTKI